MTEWAHQPAQVRIIVAQWSEGPLTMNKSSPVTDLNK